MCGLAGFIDSAGNARETLQEQVSRMAATLAHRGPDDKGAWVDEAAGIALGFRRLSIIDLSSAAAQPMVSADGRYVVVFNGEIYNFRELRAELETTGVRFRSASDTEVLLECVSRWGFEKTLKRIWGMFAIALWDREERALYLARDRVGKKPLFYGECGGIFLFGSELKALRAHPKFDSTIDRDALAAYVCFGYVPAPLSIYLSVRKLPPGHFARIRSGYPAEIQSFWDPLTVVQEGLAGRFQQTDDEAANDLESLLSDAVGRRMISDVPLGALLSGGIDSSTIVALMQKQSARPIRTFTIGFADTAYNEAKAAKAVAQHLGTDHTELYVTPEETQAVIPRLPEMYDEPFADSSQIPTSIVCRLARGHVTVSLSGDGGDEVFAGYTRYALAEKIWSILGKTPAAIRNIAARTIRATPPDRLDATYRIFEPILPERWRQSHPADKARKFSELMHAGRPDDLYRRLVSLWRKPEELVVGGTEPVSVLDDPAVPRIIPDFTERMMYLDLITYLPNDILVKVDRASMAASLEMRSPLLDHRVIEWSWRLPMRFKQRGGQSKWLFRQVLYRYVPPALVERPKMGFGVPIGAWLRGPLREWAEALLDEQRLRREGFLRPEPIRKLWFEHLSDRCREDHRLWCILMFQAWLERWQNR